MVDLIIIMAYMLTGYIITYISNYNGTNLLYAKWRQNYICFLPYSLNILFLKLIRIYWCYVWWCTARPHESLVFKLLAYLLNYRFISSICRYKGDLSELQRSPLPVSMSNLSLNKNDTLNHKVNKARWVAL